MVASQIKADNNKEIKQSSAWIKALVTKRVHTLHGFEPAHNAVYVAHVHLRG